MSSLIGTPVSLTSYDAAKKRALAWAQMRESRYVCVATTHTLMEAHDSPGFREVIRQADLVTPDGMPLVWMLRLRGERSQRRVYGPDLMLEVLEAAAQQNIPVGLYGSTPEGTQLLLARLAARFPALYIPYAYSPPFRELSPQEDEEACRMINGSGARILFVGLGCPKQELWMAAHRGRVRAVMIGVGAAFDFLAGTKKQAPHWMQSIGLEWLFRLAQEPRRLWRRYLIQNPRFVVLALSELLGLNRV